MRTTRKGYRLEGDAVLLTGSLGPRPPLLEDARANRPAGRDHREGEREGADHHQGMSPVYGQERSGERRPRVVARLDQVQHDVEVRAELVLADVQPRVVLFRDPRAERLEDHG